MTLPPLLRRRLTRALALGLLVLLATAAVAFAKSGRPAGGTKYAGKIKGGDEIGFAVSANAKKVTVTEGIPPLFCRSGGAGGIEEELKPLAISSRGTFLGTIDYRVIHGSEIATLTVNGKFAGKKVTGTVRSTWLKNKGCDGIGPFSATAAAK